MKIAIAGATGFVGKYISRYLAEKGHSIVPLTRSDFAEHNISFKILGCDAVINLTGHPVLCRWNNMNREKITESRVGTTSSIVHTISVITHPPRILINASAIGIYSDELGQTESRFRQGEGFLATVTEQWESEAIKGIYSGTRVVIARLGVVLGKNGGILHRLRPLFRLGLGAVIGNGRQKMSFIHIHDVARAFEYFLTTESCQDAYNLTCPASVTNREFTKAYASVLGKKAWLRIPRFLLRLRFGQASSFLTGSQDVIPERLLNESFQFAFPNLEACLKATEE